MPKKRPSDGLVKKLRDFGLKYPGAHLKSPWPDHLDLAVKDKTFAYLSAEGEPFSISCKLPDSHTTALLLPFAEPTGWGLGKSGWVTARFAPGKQPNLEMLKAWIDESYRAQAPKKLSAQLALALTAHATKAATKAPTAAKARSARGTPAKPSAKRARRAAAVKR